MLKFRVCLIILATVFLPLSHIEAAGWWGNGYKPPAWILANGGSIIRLNIRGGDAEEFKAFMTKAGKYVEVEFGDNMLFDDAKDGTYVITVYDCNRDCSYQERNDKKRLRGNDSKKASISVVARPGKTTYLTYDTDKKTLFVTGSDVPKAAPPKPQLTPAQLIAQAAVADQGKACDVTRLHPAAKSDYFIFPSQ